MKNDGSFSSLIVGLVLARKPHGRCSLLDCVGWKLQAGD